VAPKQAADDASQTVTKAQGATMALQPDDDDGRAGDAEQESATVAVARSRSTPHPGTTSLNKNKKLRSSSFSSSLTPASTPPPALDATASRSIACRALAALHQQVYPEIQGKLQPLWASLLTERNRQKVD
jgi:hypothetical protein